jgi:cardiolipin synthase
MWPRLIEHHWITLHGLVVFAGLAIYVIGSHTLHQRRHPASAVAWILTLVLLPYVALPLYLMFGSRKLGAYAPPAPRSGNAAEALPTAPGAGVRQLAAALGLPAPAGYAQLNLHEDGAQALAALRAGIGQARRSLEVCTFILARDALGREVMQLLEERARAGVRVRLLVDGIGIFLGRYPSLKRLRRAGIETALFVPPLHSPLRGRTNLRNHRKMVIADGQWFWCGGRNLASEYFEGEPGKAPWTDLSFDLRGAVAQEAARRFAHDWNFAVHPRPAEPMLPPGPPASTQGPVAQLVPSGPDQADDTVYTLLVSACFAAKKRILIATPYFVPDPTLLMALSLAARRGLHVDLLLPMHSNHRLADISRRRALRELAAAGARLWLTPGMMHAKAVVIDDELALVGSANLDARSLFLNYELMVAFYDVDDVHRYAVWIRAQMEKALSYHPRPASLLREMAEGTVLWLAFQL